MNAVRKTQAPRAATVGHAEWAESGIAVGGQVTGSGLNRFLGYRALRMARRDCTFNSEALQLTGDRAAHSKVDSGVIGNFLFQETTRKAPNDLQSCVAPCFGDSAFGLAPNPVVANRIDKVATLCC